MSSVLGHWIRFVKERQTEDPGVFGPHGGFGRAYALNEVLSTGAMMAGPILSGVLQLAIGYYYMNVVFGEFTRPVTVLKNILMLSLVDAMFMPLSVLAFWYLRGAGESGPGEARNSPTGNEQP